MITFIVMLFATVIRLESNKVFQFELIRRECNKCVYVGWTIFSTAKHNDSYHMTHISEANKIHEIRFQIGVYFKVSTKYQ